MLRRTVCEQLAYEPFADTIFVLRCKRANRLTILALGPMRAAAAAGAVRALFAARYAAYCCE